MNLAHLETVQARIKKAAVACGRNPEEVKLVVVSKRQSVASLQMLYKAGIRDFGESRVQEAEEKQKSLPQDISWHMIGSLQTNKVRKVIGRYSVIHSVDSLHLAEKIDTVSCESSSVTRILLEVNTSKEASKHGLTEDELVQQFPSFLALKNVMLCGLMTMAPRCVAFDAVELKKVRSCFSRLRMLKERLQTEFPEIKESFKELSMGMSQDFEMAIEEGATLVRIGSLIFE